MARPCTIQKKIEYAYKMKLSAVISLVHWSSGTPIMEIAARAGCTHAGIYALLKREGLKARTREEWDKYRVKKSWQNKKRVAKPHPLRGLWE